MRGVVLLAGLAVGVVVMSPQAQVVCNVRGEFCGYPAWAANAFAHPRDRVPDAWLEPPVRKTYRVKRYKTRHRSQ